MSDDGTEMRPIARLWQLRWKGDSVSCTIYRHGTDLELRLESPTAVIFAEPFELQPRMLARTQSLRESLKQRGWRDTQEES